MHLNRLKLAIKFRQKKVRPRPRRRRDRESNPLKVATHGSHYWWVRKQSLDLSSHAWRSSGDFSLQSTRKRPNFTNKTCSYIRPRLYQMRPFRWLFCSLCLLCSLWRIQTSNSSWRPFGTKGYPGSVRRIWSFRALKCVGLAYFFHFSLSPTSFVRGWASHRSCGSLSSSSFALQRPILRFFVSFFPRPLFLYRWT